MLLAARLYPRPWRERYGEEFEAAIEDYRPGWRELGDIVGGALNMQIRRGDMRLVAALAAAGAIAMAVVAYRSPQTYASSAVVRVPPGNLDMLRNELTSRTFLRTIILNPSFNLYPEIRERYTNEDAIERMQKDLQIRAERSAVRLSFVYPDKAKAQAVVRRVADAFVRQNAVIEENRAGQWRAMWPKDPPLRGRKPAQALAPASLPEKPLGPNRIAFIAIGLGAGLLAGAVAPFAIRRPKRSLVLSACAVAGGAVAVALAFPIPDRYVSTAAIRVVPPFFPERPSGAALAASMPERFAQAEQYVSERLPALVESFDLYPTERGRKPVSELVREMRRNLRIVKQDWPSADSGAPFALTISFTSPDRYKAQRAVNELVAAYVTAYVRAGRVMLDRYRPGDEIREIADRGLGDCMEVLDPASLPESPVSPGRGTIAGGGVAFGLLAGALALYRRRSQPAARPLA